MIRLASSVRYTYRFPADVFTCSTVAVSYTHLGEQTQGQIHKRRRGKLIQMVLPLRLLPSDHENQGYLITSFRPFRLPA